MVGTDMKKFSIAIPILSQCLFALCFRFKSSCSIYKCSSFWSCFITHIFIESSLSWRNLSLSYFSFISINIPQCVKALHLFKSCWQTLSDASTLCKGLPWALSLFQHCCTGVPHSTSKFQLASNLKGLPLLVFPEFLQ